MEFEYDENPMAGFEKAAVVQEEQASVEVLTELVGKEESELTDDDKALLEKSKDKIDEIRANIEKEQAEGSGGDGDLGVVGNLMKSEGFVGEGEFEDSSEGLGNYMKERDTARDQQVLTSFLKASPELASFYKHTIVDKKPAESFMRRLDKPTILTTEIKPLGESLSDVEKVTVLDSHRAIIKANLKGKVSETVLNSIIESAVEKGETEQLAKDSLADLTTAYNGELKLLEDQAQTLVDTDALNYENAQRVIKATVGKGALASNVIIPESEKLGFIDFLTKPINTMSGETKQQQVVSSLSPEQDLLLDYLLYKFSISGKFDIGSLKTRSSNKQFFNSAKGENDRRQSRDKGRVSGDGKINSVKNLPSNMKGVTFG